MNNETGLKEGGRNRKSKLQCFPLRDARSPFAFSFTYIDNIIKIENTITMGAKNIFSQLEKLDFLTT